MARWKPQVIVPDVPPEVAEYNPVIHGVGALGIRRWKEQALAYLAGHPGAVLPCMDHPAEPSSSVFAVILTARDLLAREWNLPQS